MKCEVMLSSQNYIFAFLEHFKLLAREEPFNSRKRKNLKLEAIWRDKNTKEVNLEKKREEEDWEKNREASEGVVI